MKRSLRFLRIAILFVCIYSCGSSGEEVDMASLSLRGELMYEANAESPFTGKGVSRYDNEQQKHVISFKKGKKHGLEEKFMENGQKTQIQSYKDNMLDGKSSFYYPNGQLQKEIEYTKGVKNGEYLLYYENGKKQLESYVKDGKSSGKFISYYDNGQVQKKGSYKENKEDGTWVEYSQEGKELSRKDYKDGKPHGDYITYNPENGKMLVQKKYDEGTEVGESKQWAYNGTLTEHVTVEGNRRRTRRYTEDGTLTFDCYYMNSVRKDGPCLTYENDHKIMEEEYSNGKRTSYKRWNNDGTLRPDKSALLGDWGASMSSDWNLRSNGTYTAFGGTTGYWSVNKDVTKLTKYYYYGPGNKRKKTMVYNIVYFSKNYMKLYNGGTGATIEKRR